MSVVSYRFLGGGRSELSLERLEGFEFVDRPPPFGLECSHRGLQPVVDVCPVQGSGHTNSKSKDNMNGYNLDQYPASRIYMCMYHYLPSRSN